MRIQNSQSAGAVNQTAGQSDERPPLDAGFQRTPASAAIKLKDGSTAYLWQDKNGNITTSQLLGADGHVKGTGSYSPQTGEWQQLKYQPENGNTDTFQNLGGGKYSRQVVDPNGNTLDPAPGMPPVGPSFDGGRTTLLINGEGNRELDDPNFGPRPQPQQGGNGSGADNRQAVSDDSPSSSDASQAATSAADASGPGTEE